MSGLVSSSNKLEQAAPPAAWRYPRLIAHRGGGVLAPENTLAALRMAATRGYRAVEFDVMLSADGTPMLIHDETLERTSSGRGAVAETSDATLVTLDAGSWFGGSFAGEPLPRFLDAGRLCVSTGLWANVEIKPSPGADYATGRAAARLAAELWADAALPPLLSSFSTVALEAARETAPHLPRGLLYDAPPENCLSEVRRLGCVSLHCNCRYFTADLLAQAQAHGVPVALYTVNDIHEARRWLAEGVAAIITDRIDLIAPDLFRPN